MEILIIFPEDLRTFLLRIVKFILRFWFNDENHGNFSAMNKWIKCEIKCSEIVGTK